MKGRNGESILFPYPDWDVALSDVGSKVVKSRTAGEELARNEAWRTYFMTILTLNIIELELLSCHVNKS
jgi:hypothetical protein